jgi:Plasmid pRiA4b ORF-3-like protein
MVWRRVLLPSTCTLRELHGGIQVAMGWEGIHLYRFRLRARHYGSWELSASSPEVALAALRLRKGARLTYEYDPNIPWQHEVRIEENRLEAEPESTYPRCTGGSGACPPEDCGGPEGYLAGLDEATSLDAEDLDTMSEILGQVVLERRPEGLDDETRWRLENAIERSKARDRARGRPFSRRSVNLRLRKGEHLGLMHQQC